MDLDYENLEIKLDSSKSHPKDILYHLTNDKDCVTRPQQFDEEVLNYINIYSSNYDVYIIYGLININNIETQNVKLELFINDKNHNTQNITSGNSVSNVDNNNTKDNTNSVLESLDDKLLSLYVRKLDVDLRDLVNVNVNYKYYNNSNMMLYIDLVNNSEIVYELVNVNILYNNHVLISNTEGAYSYTIVLVIVVKTTQLMC